MGRSLFVAAALGVVVALPVSAQTTPNSILEAHRVRPKPGMAQQLESGRMKHMAWHKQQGDTFAWHVWEITTGPETGGHLVVSPGHNWADFDAWDAKYGKGDRADAAVNLAPHQASSEMSYWALLEDATRPGAPGQAPMGTLTTYHVRPGKANQFREAIRTIKGALDKGNYPRASMWYSLVNGGPGNTYAVFSPRKNMAEMALTQPTLRGTVEASLGKAASDTVFQSFSDAVESSTTELLAFRADLSHVPAGQGTR